MSDNVTPAAIAKAAGKRPVSDLQIVGVANLKPSDIGKAVRVKVYRKWTVTQSRGTKQTLSFILLDQQGGAIQANVEGRERIRFDNILQKHGAYTITGFGLMDTKPWMRTLPNHFTLILGKFTDVQPYAGNGFPIHHFNFASYSELPLRADRNEAILTDYIGCVLNVGEVREPANTSQKQVVWRDIMLKNLERDTVRFTLWNENARSFDTDAYEKEAKPTVMAVSSCWVKTYGGLQLSSTPASCYYFNPPIPETDYILSLYNELVPQPVIQNVRTYRYENIEQEKRRNRVTIDELLREDPRNQTNVRFTVIATVLEVIVGIPWYFRRCHDCRHKIFEGRPHAHCEPPNPGEPDDYSYCFRISIADDSGTLILKCFSNEAHSMVRECNKVVSEGHVDPYTLPPVVTALEGTTHVFQLHYATESTNEYPVYILDTVMETGPHLLAAPQENAAANLADPQPENETLMLTGPETNTQQESQPLATVEEPPATPVATEIMQVSTPVTTETIGGVHEHVTKKESTKPSVRRQLLKDDACEETTTAAKKPKQQE